MLKIIRSSDPLTIDHLILTEYGPPGVGKTTLAFSARDPLSLDFDSGAHRATRNRKDVVSITSWSDVSELSAEHLAPYKTVIVDTVGRALDVLAADIIRRDPKMANGPSLSLKGFGRLKGEFAALMNRLRSFGVDIVLIAHSDEQRNGDDVIERIDAQGSSKNEVYKCSDAMCRLALRDGKRVLLFSPTDTTFGKNPGGLGPLPVPEIDSRSTFLGDVIEEIKTRINAQTEEQRAVGEALASWAAEMEKATTAAALNKLIKRVDEIDPRARDNAKRALWSYAKNAGFAFDAGNKKFVEVEEEAATEELEAVTA